MSQLCGTLAGIVLVRPANGVGTVCRVFVTHHDQEAVERLEAQVVTLVGQAVKAANADHTFGDMNSGTSVPLFITTPAPICALCHRGELL